MLVLVVWIVFLNTYYLRGFEPIAVKVKYQKWTVVNESFLWFFFLVNNSVVQQYYEEITRVSLTLCTYLPECHHKRATGEHVKVVFGGRRVRVGLNWLFHLFCQKPSDNMTLIAILVSCGALLAMIVGFAIYASYHRKSYRKNLQVHN